MADPQDDGWETITDPTDVPQNIRKSLGVAGVRQALGLGGKGAAGSGASSGKPVPQWAKKDFETALTPFSQLDRALSGFKSEYAGNTITGDLENKIQSRFGGFGSAGQRDWWAQVREADNKIRNELFGAALTKGEEEAYKSTTIAPDMDPAIVQQNLKRRRDILQAATGRQYKFLRAQGYNPESVQALAGTYAADFDPDASAERQAAREAAKGGDQQSSTAGAVVDGSGAPPSGPNATPPGGSAPPPQNRDAGGTLQFADEGPQVQAGSQKLTDAQAKQLQDLAQTGASAQQLAILVSGFGRAPDADSMKNLEGIAAFYAKPENRGTPLGVDYSRDEVKPVDAGDGALGAGARGAGNALTFGLMDEAGAVADTVTQGGTYDQNLDRRRGMELYDEQNHGISRFAGQVVGGLPLGALNIADAAQAARAAGIAAVRSGVPVAEARALSTRILASRNALEAAGMGAAYGFGDADGGLGSRVAGAGIGGAVGGALGGALSLGGSRFQQALAARRGAAPATGANAGQETLAAMERQGVTPFAPDVGGATVRRATSAVAQTLPGASPIVAGARRTVADSQAVRDRVAQGIGQVVELNPTGEAARRGANMYQARTSAQIGRIYDAAEQAGGQARIQTPEALRVLNQELIPLEESPVEGAGVGILQGLRDRLQGDVTVRGLRNARTVLREEFENNNMRFSNTERIANRVLDAATDDIANGLRAQGQERAANLYQRADRLWRERTEIIDEHLEPIIGGRGAKAASSEQIVKNLKSAMSGNNRRFVGFVNALPPEERNTVRASLISRLGQAPKGQQDETGELFSLNTFLTHWNDIGEGAKNRLFGEEGRAALNDLARIATGAREAQRFANHSNSGGAIGNLATGATTYLGIKTLGATLVTQYGAGRLLASPRFARWLARPPRQTTPEAMRAYTDRLTRIARSEPAIASDVLSLQSRLADAFGAAPARLAAQPGNNSTGVANGDGSNSQGQGREAQQ